jgi:hypothetical protein
VNDQFEPAALAVDSNMLGVIPDAEVVTVNARCSAGVEETRVLEGAEGDLAAIVDRKLPNKHKIIKLILFDFLAHRRNFLPFDHSTEKKRGPGHVRGSRSLSCGWSLIQCVKAV